MEANSDHSRPTESTNETQAAPVFVEEDATSNITIEVIVADEDEIEDVNPSVQSSNNTLTDPSPSDENRKQSPETVLNEKEDEDTGHKGAKTPGIKDDEIISGNKDEENTSGSKEEENTSGSKEEENTAKSKDDEVGLKSLSREMKSLINSAKDSKIISEFTQITTKMRKSRNLDTSGMSANTSLETDKLIGSRRSSENSLISSSSDISDRPGCRSMRSQNPEFLHKQRKFLNSLSGKLRKDCAEGSHASSESDLEENTAQDGSSKKLSQENIKTDTKKQAKLSDKFCWRCHWLIEPTPTGMQTPRCSVCPRAYHPKCLSSKAGNSDRPGWACPECMMILHAEASDTRSQAMQKTSLSALCTLLNYALARMKLVNGVEEFLQPVDPALCPDYREHVVHPMDLGRVQQNILDGLYGSTEAFLSDTMWILHNCLVYNSPVRSRLTVAARALVRECRKEMGEIEACPECYAAAHARRPTWFTDVCSTPHILLWAKLKGFPFWPAKGMTVNEMGMVDVRFFGDHDRAWVPAKYCYLYSHKDPNNTRSQRSDIVESIKEAEQHIKNIIRKFGSFVHAAPRTPFEPARQGEQLKTMIPDYNGVLPAPRLLKEVSNNTGSPANKTKRPRSTSKGSKDSIEGYGTDDDDDDTSVNESLRDKSVDVETAINSPGRSIKKKRPALEEVKEFSVLETRRKRKRISSDETSTDRDLSSKETIINMEDMQVDDVKATTTEKDVEIIEIDVPNKCEEKESKKYETIESPIKAKNNIKDLSVDKIDAKRKVYVKSIDGDKEENNKMEKNYTSSPILTNKSSSIPDNKKPFDINSVHVTKQQNIVVLSEKQKPPAKLFTRGDQLPTITNVRSLATQEAVTKLPLQSNTNSEKNDLSAKHSSQENKSSNGKTSSPSKDSQKQNTDKDKKNKDVNCSNNISRSILKNTNLFIDVEIKSEPMDYDERQKSVEKNDLLGSLNLRPAGTAETTPVSKTSDLRTVRRMVTTNKPSLPARARKTFPQPRRTSPISDEGRPDLNGKNTMVYIPIQPPTTSAPPPLRVSSARPVRTTVGSTSSASTINISNPPALSATSSPSATSYTTSVSIPSVSEPPSLMSASNVQSPATVTPTTTVAISSNAVTTSVISTVPVISSLNGQWTLCIPPLVSLDTNTPTTVNGMSEHPPPLIETSPSAVTSRTPIITAVPTSSLIAAPRELPTLQPRPGHPLDPATPIGALPVPSAAGPCSEQINQSAVKLADFFRNVLTESLQVLDDPAATVASLRLQLEQLAWTHKQELAEFKHNADMQVMEMRGAMEREKAAVVAEARRVAEMELNAAVNHAKSKTWCANCRQEAQFYCCWNTSYCDYPCQQAHWTQHHFSVCSQKRNQDQLNQQPGLEDSCAVKVVGGKTLPKSFPSGGVGPTVRAAGAAPAPGLMGVNMQTPSTYKRPNFNQPAFIINKQLLSSEEATTKVTPGGYLIVGGSNTGRPVVSHSSPHNSL